jgi:hypothetical protein
MSSSNVADTRRTVPRAARAIVATIACVYGVACDTPIQFAVFYTGGGQEGLALLVIPFALVGFVAGLLAAGSAALLFPGLERIAGSRAGAGGAIGFALTGLLVAFPSAVPQSIATWANPVAFVVPLWLGVFWGCQAAAPGASPSKSR